MAKGHLIKRSKIWYARYYSPSGRRKWHSLQTTSKEIAQAKFSKLIESIEKQEVGWRLRGVLITEYLPQYIAICEVEHAKKTYRTEKQILKDFLAFANVQYLHQIASDRLEAYKVKRAKEVSKSTINRSITVIKAFLNRAVILGFLEKNPVQYVKKLKEEQRQIKYLSDIELRKLLKVCSPKVMQIITVFALTGMRLGELAHLRWKDVDYRHNFLNIQNQPDWTTKSYRPRVIPMHPLVKKIFESLRQGQEEQEYIFKTRNGKPIDSYIRAEILRYANKAGIHASVKMLRSTFASNLVMKGVDIYTVSKLLGHHDVKITEKHYAHLTPNFLNESINRLDLVSGN